MLAILMMMVVVAMMLSILKFKIWRPMHPMIVDQAKPQKTFLGNLFYNVILNL